jgi:hypothetical protein
MPVIVKYYCKFISVRGPGRAYDLTYMQLILNGIRSVLLHRLLLSSVEIRAKHAFIHDQLCLASTVIVLVTVPCTQSARNRDKHSINLFISISIQVQISRRIERSSNLRVSW